MDTDAVEYAEWKAIPSFARQLPLYDSNPIDTSQLYPLNINSGALVNSLRVKSGPGILFGFSVFNNKGSAQFLQVFDSQTLPAEGLAPELTFTMAASSNFATDWIPGRTFRRGIWIVNSSTAATKTIGSADCYIDAQFV